MSPKVNRIKPVGLWGSYIRYYGGGVIYIWRRWSWGADLTYGFIIGNSQAIVNLNDAHCLAYQIKLFESMPIEFGWGFKELLLESNQFGIYTIFIL